MMGLWLVVFTALEIASIVPSGVSRLDKRIDRGEAFATLTTPSLPF